MFAKGKGSSVPSDGQAREKLALYVYEYLLHVGAQKSAQTFLSEIRWEKNITLGEPPGFLHSWWCVFWDLYCAAPERRDTCEHSSEAKAFHDYLILCLQGPPGGGGPPGTPIMPSPADSTNSSDNIYTMINAVPPGGNRTSFPMGPGSDGPMGGMGGMEPHHMNGSLGSGDIDGLPKNSPNNISGISNPPGTPRDDGELGGNFLHSFQNDNDKNESAVIWKIKESSQEAAKHFGKEPGKHPEFSFMQ
ncbi:single-stranded DNA-binding protein 3-like [Polyodon spathula]|uniref:single-stranded DNA-binding protein 3-like n=1 Tax=Polyodon spathula TaxID=7913 RepID=UPI001B7EF006|nr:single-stranded DNA-binding protein 3-like [Polyodon spathula]